MKRDEVEPRGKRRFCLGAGVVLLLVGAGVVAWFVAGLRVVIELEIRAGTSDPCEVWIRGIRVGETPLVLDEEELERLGEYFHDDDISWGEMHAGPRTGSDDLWFDYWTSAPGREAGEEDYLYLVRTSSGRFALETGAIGFRVRVHGPDGEALVCVRRTEGVTLGIHALTQRDVLEFAPLSARPLHLTIVSGETPAEVRVAGEPIGPTPLSMTRERMASLSDRGAPLDPASSVERHARDSPWRTLRVVEDRDVEGESVLIVWETLHADERLYFLRLGVTTPGGAELVLVRVNDESVDDDYRLELVFGER